MKKLILTIAIALTSLITVAQPKSTKDAQGNYLQVKSDHESTPAKITGKTFTTSKGEVFPVMESKNGKLFIVRTAKVSGKQYKQYLQD
jgi:hypothetical protein